MGALPLDNSHLPLSAFIDPAGHNRFEVEALLHQTVALLVEEMTRASARSLLPDPMGAQQLSQWAQQWAKIPEQSVAADVLLDVVRSQLHHSMNAAHPGYIGHMDSIPTTMSIIADLLVAALNNNMLSVEMSPVFSRLEPLVMQQLAAHFGLDLADRDVMAGGVMVSGGSLANLQALTVARNMAFDALATGIVKLSQQPVFFVSEVAHTSMQKAAMVMGLGAQAAIALRTNTNAQVDIHDLKVKLSQAEQSGQKPFAIVATAGTTVTGSIDPLAEMADVAQANNLWFHVDAAYGGALIFSPAHRHLLAGIDRADSVTFNPQKWLYITKTCATLLFKNVDVLQRHFRISAPYMGDDSQWSNLGELTLQGTRHPDILKLWLSLQHLGQAGYADIITHNIALTAQFTEAVRSRPYLQLASEPQTNLVCFRLAPKQIAAEAWDHLNEQLQQYLLAAKSPVFLSLPTYRHQRWLKAVLLNPYSCTTTIEHLFEQLDAFVQEHVS
ncbi:MAG: aminotransferase class I/II-fold pyridoxal phosphate-dependent enzyme [Phormidesmis sp. RL_2_1]|nr:aminotransferase class I/II-fold pyridoxal phosphate-dependent enzyme [Phormidesmis sp. RL_2_1]